ncbi:hypothetical protein TNCV_3432821 [Trichonephila clavipes]|nr:hypothetical protein TNCV_3432821 [Trichonephila clavipes]
MVSTGINLNGRTHRYVFARDTMLIAVSHRGKVMEPYVRLFMVAVVLVSMLLDDKLRHIDLICSMNFLKVMMFAEWIGQLCLQASPV